jgi:hypothetical protein|nr:MAG TPA: hypothetical protein [Caudoviricetes sp.]
MNYITLTDIRDNLITCEQSDVDESNAYVSGLAVRLGVNEADIPSAIPVIVKRLCVVYACYLRCLQLIGTDNLTAFETINQDIYAQKLEFFRLEVNRITNSLCATDFTGKKVAGGSVPLWRG